MTTTTTTTSTPTSTPPRKKKIRLGILVPSSNTTLEPLTTHLLSSLPHISLHFSRFPVTEISLSPTALSQFSLETILAAAVLLSHAQVDVIGWSGTSAGWLGLDADVRLCERITERTGIPATSSVLGLWRLLETLVPSTSDGVEGRQGKGRVGLVTPYLDDVQGRVVETFRKGGWEVGAESHLNRRVNVEFAEVGEEVLDRQMREVVQGLEGESTSVKVVSTFCTNLRAAQRVAYWEREYPGLVVLDTVATVVWDMLRIVEVDMKEIVGWGGMFGIVPSAP